MQAQSSGFRPRARKFGWRLWLSPANREPREGNPCQGIALAVLLSLPIWLFVGLVTFAVGLD